MTLIYPGSFDPITLGHIDIAMRGAKIATTLVVAVLHNPEKKPLFTLDERVRLLKNELGSISNIDICSFDGMLVELAAEKGATAILRGLRGISDFEAETNLAIYNKLLSDTNVETVFLVADALHTHVSSSGAKEVASLIYGNNLCDNPLDTVVSKNVKNALKQKFSRHRAVR